jgi:hypothetical protein
MPHIYDKIDCTVAVFVGQQAKVLLVPHRALGKWLPLGGHIELNADPVLRNIPQQYAYRGSTDERRRATTGHTDTYAHLDRGWRPHDRRGYVG